MTAIVFQEIWASLKVSAAPPAAEHCQTVVDVHYLMVVDVRHLEVVDDLYIVEVIRQHLPLRLELSHPRRYEV